MKALVIAPQPFFSCRGTPLSVYYRTSITAELGVQIDLLTYGEGQDVDIPGVRIIRIPRFRFLGNVKIGPSWLKLFLDFFLIFWTIALLLKNKYQFVHAHEEAVFICYFLKPFFKFKLIYDMHSSLPEQLINFKFTKSKLLIEIFRALEKGCLRNAEAIITICPSLYHYAKRIISSNQLVILIENSVVEEVKISNQPQPHKRLSRARLNSLSEKRLVVYAGTLEPYQGIDILLSAFQYAIAQEPDLFLLVIGGTKEQIEYYSHLADRSGVSQHCAFTGNISLKAAKDYLDRAAVQISSRISGKNTPLKVYDQLTRSIPIVATNIDCHRQVLNEEVAFLVKPEPHAMAQGILAALKPDGEGQQRAMNAQRLYEQKYSRRIYKDKMRYVLENLNVLQKDIQVSPSNISEEIRCVE
jgi:glycosyltransferase involved in cell wall biosynthesis